MEEISEPSQQMEYEVMEQAQINLEYKIWKKEAPSLYEFMLQHSVDWPTYTFQWLPETQVHEQYTSLFAIIGASHAQHSQCELLKIKVDYPNQSKAQEYFQRKGHKITVVKKVAHAGEITRARCSPVNSNIIAVATDRGDISLVRMDNNPIKPTTKLLGHTEEGYGLSWNNMQNSLLLSGFHDGRLCIWDILKNKQQNGSIKPARQILYHKCGIEDVSWHKFHPSIFSSCSDDRLIDIWDARSGQAAIGPTTPIFEIKAHTDQIYSLDFSPVNEFLLASGSRDENVSVWDLRNLTRPFATLHANKNQVIKVQWSPCMTSLLASGGFGRNVDIWDLSKKEENQDLRYLLRHKGHRSKVLDFDWHPTEKLLLGSVQENNCVHIWQMDSKLYYQDEKEQ